MAMRSGLRWMKWCDEVRNTSYRVTSRRLTTQQPQKHAPIGNKEHLSNSTRNDVHDDQEHLHVFQPSTLRFIKAATWTSTFLITGYLVGVLEWKQENHVFKSIKPFIKSIINTNTQVKNNNHNRDDNA